MKNVLALSAILCALILSSCTQQSAEVSQWRGPNRDGIFNETNLLDQWPENGPELLWKFNDLGLGYSSPTFAHDKIYINGTLDSISHLFVFSMDGELLWKKPYGEAFMKSFPGTRTGVIVLDDLCYILGGKGVLYCLKAENGELVWKEDLVEKYQADHTRYGFSENLLIKNDRVYITAGGKEYNLIALNRFDGKLIWSNEGNKERSAYCNPILFDRGGEEFLVTLTDKSVYAVKTKDGSLAWMLPLEGVKNGIHANTPIYRDGKLFVMDGFKTGCFLLEIAEDGMSAKKLWKNQLLDETQGHCIVKGNHIYGSAESKKKTICIDWNTGEVLFEMDKYSPNTMISADDKLFVYSYKGELALLEVENNQFLDKGSVKLEKRKQLHISHPVIFDGKLYIRYAEELYAFNIAKN